MFWVNTNMEQSPTINTMMLTLVNFAAVMIPMPIDMPTSLPKATSFVSSLAKIIRVHELRILLMVRDLHVCHHQHVYLCIRCLVAAKHDTTLVDREETPRMPWHDMSCAVVSSFVVE